MPAPIAPSSPLRVRSFIAPPFSHLQRIEKLNIFAFAIDKRSYFNAVEG
jgi:hypothetical protein